MAQTKKNKLKIIPLGGLGEIGKNITAVEYDDDIIVIDCGMAFPEDEMLGIDIVIPDVTYLIKNKEKVNNNRRFFYEIFRNNNKHFEFSE